MKQQKSRAYIHQVVYGLREQSTKHELKHNQQQQIKKQQKISKSNTATMQNSSVMSQSQKQTQFQNTPQQKFNKNLNLFNIINSISSSDFSTQKNQNELIKRQIKTARPVSRRKVTSKDKYSRTVKPIEEIFKIDMKKNQMFETLQILHPEDFIEEKENYKSKQNCSQVNIKAFWSLEHKFVSLFPIQNNQFISYNHPNILPIYGQVKLKNKRYVVSNQYKNATLKDLIRQFGPFQQKLCKKYLYQIVCGVQQMHNKKMAHNRLNSQNILYNKQGQIFINVVKSTSKPLTPAQKNQRLFQYCPQILLSKTKSNSLKCDIWSIGIVLLDMLFNFGTFNASNLIFHPYNQDQTSLQKNDSIMIDNLKQLYRNCFQKKEKQQFKNQQNIKQKYQNLSVECKDFIEKCLIFKNDQRPNIKVLKEHDFFNKSK